MIWRNQKLGLILVGKRADSFYASNWFLEKGDMTEDVRFGEQGPMEEDPAAREYQQHVEFQRAIAAAPKPVVTYGLIAINVAVYLAMVISGISPMQPTPAQVLAWGGNSGPFTMYGEWWRLITACFLHYGLIHIGMNMFILFQAGIFVEKLFGNVRYLLLYLLAGVGGNIAGLYIHPLSIAAGASGAVFGVYGGLLGFLVVQHGVVPRSNSVAIAKSAGIFLAYNLVYGLSSKTTDLTAHVGGLVTGFVMGCALAQPLSAEGQRTHPMRTLTVGIAGVAAAYMAMTMAPREAVAEARWVWEIQFGPSVTVGTNDKVWYSGGATKEQALAVGQVLEERGVFSNHEGAAVLAKRKGETDVGLIVREGIWNEPKMITEIEELGRAMAGAAGGLPIHMELLDSEGRPRKDVLVR